MPLGGPESAGGDHGLRGIYYAIVTQNDDQDGPGGRVKVRFPWMPEGDRDQTRWAPVAAPMAGEEFGVYWLPEVGDTVAVVFIAGDVLAPVVLGGCYSKEDKPPKDNADGKNDFRLLKSRCGHQLVFDDSSEKKVVLSEKSDGNVATCSGDGVSVTSASGTINLVCPSGKLKIQALDVVVHADQGLDASGSDGVTAQTPAQAKIGSSSKGTYAGSQLKVGP